MPLLLQDMKILCILFQKISNEMKKVYPVCHYIHINTFSIADAKTVASSFDCKYTETSGALNHNVDELLVGILKQIRLKQAEKARFSASGGRRKNRLAGNLSVPTGKSPRNLGVPRRKSAGLRVRGLLDKMLGVDSKSKSCDDLNVL